MALGMKASDMKKAFGAFLRAEKEVAEARRAMIEANLRLVISIAKTLSWKRSSAFPTSFRKGTAVSCGLWTNSNTGRGYKFSTYATWWIRQAITRALADQSRTIRIPVHMVETMNKITKDIHGNLCRRSDGNLRPGNRRPR
jgi:RNA polymerase primary sigma factor